MKQKTIKRYINKLNRLEEEIFHIKVEKRTIIKELNNKGYDVIGKSYGLPYPTYHIYNKESDELLDYFWGKE